MQSNNKTEIQMKFMLEFGNRGGAHTDNVVLPTEKLAVGMAARLVMVFQNDPHAIGASTQSWWFPRNHRQATWQSATHFVALTKLDGRNTGGKAGALWRKSEQAPLFAGPVHSA